MDRVEDSRLGRLAKATEYRNRTGFYLFTYFE